MAEWLQKNALAIILTTSALAVAWGALNFRVNAVEERMKTFPSKDWFELKFQNVDDKLVNVEDRLQKIESQPPQPTIIQNK